MNIMFWALVVLMLLAAIAIVIFPLLRVRTVNAIAYRESNVQLYEDKLQELSTDLADGRIDQAHYARAQEELDRELLADIPVEDKEASAESAAAVTKRRPILALLMALFLPVLVLPVYLQLGTLDIDKAQVAAEHGELSVAEMVARLEQRLESETGSAQEWAMLGRAYKHLGRFKDSAAAFAVAVEREPDAQLLLEQSESLALANDHQFDSEATALIMKALALEPENINVLLFAGVAEFQAGNFHESIEYLSKLSGAASSDKSIDQSIRIYIDKAREQLIAAGESVASVDEILQTKPASTNTVSGARIELLVSVSEEAKAQFNDTDIVFVYAKALQGPQMPLAVQRMTLGDLPTTVVLDDSMAMVDGMNLSTFGSVMVSARIARSGSAIAESGDYIGEAKVKDVAVAESYKVIINTLVP